MSTALVFDMAAFAVLLGLSVLVRSRFRHHGYSTTSAFGIVMGIAIFADFCLPQLPFYSPLLARLITLELLVIWLFLAGSYCASALNRHFRMHIAHLLQRFAIGTWVAGTAVLAVLAAHTLPEAHALGKALTFVAVAVYLPYVVVFVHGYAKLLRHPLRQNANGVILLATVSTQSIVIALVTTFSTDFPAAAAAAIGMAAFDMIFLCSGLVLITLHYHAIGSWLLAVEWKNANCIVHGAVSITGLTLALTSNFGPDVLLGVWEVAFVLFVVVETLEFVRLVEREHRRGFRRGLLVYDTTQWTRNFTYGMFYAFTLKLTQLPRMGTLDTHIYWWSLVKAVAHWGQYVVLLFLLVEIVLFFRARLHLGWHAHGLTHQPRP